MLPKKKKLNKESKSICNKVSSEKSEQSKQKKKGADLRRKSGKAT